MSAIPESPPQLPIRTARLLLRPFQPSDLDQLHLYLARADVARYLYSEPTDRAGSRRELRRRVRSDRLRREGDALQLAIVVVEQGLLAGEVVLRWTSAEHRQGEVGFILNPDFHGQGIATEAARAMLELGFAELGMHRIVARADARNTPSVRVMERLGMRLEAHLVENEFVKGEWTDEVIFALRSGDWARALTAPP